MRIILRASIERWRHRTTLLSRLVVSDNLKQLKVCDVLLFCHDVDRSIDLNGTAYSPLLDSIREDLEAQGLSCLSVAHFGSSLTGKKGYGEPVSFNRMYIWHRLIRKAFNLLGIPAGLKSDPYAYMLEKTGAQLVVTIGSPTELISAAKTKGVFHVELLHGIGYLSLPWGWDKLHPDHLPHGILSLDEISTTSFNPLMSKGVEIQTIPHPFLKRFTLGRSHTLPADWIVSNVDLKKYSKHILVSLSWGYAGDHGPYAHLANILDNGLFFNELEQLIREESGIFWHFRFHPVQLRTHRYKRLLNYMDNFVLTYPNSEWREASRLPFPSVVTQCQGNVCMSSMSCYDAAAMGVPSLMLCPTLQKGGFYQDYFADLENEGYVIKATINAKMLRDWVQKTRKIKPRLSNLDDNMAWENAVEWMLKKSGLENQGKRQALK